MVTCGPIAQRGALSTVRNAAAGRRDRLTPIDRASVRFALDGRLAMLQSPQFLP